MYYSESELRFEPCKLGELPAQRMLRSLEEEATERNQLVLYYAQYPDKEQVSIEGNGIIFLRCEYYKNNVDRKSLDIIERMISSFRICNGVINREEEKDQKHYENLNWGFGFKYNSTQFKPKKFGSLIKLSSPDNKMGEIITMVRPIVFNTDDMSLSLFIQEYQAMVQEEIKNAKISETKIMRTHGLEVRYFLATSQTHKVLNYLFRHENNWFMIRWIVNSEYEKNKIDVDKIVKSFYFF